MEDIPNGAKAYSGFLNGINDADSADCRDSGKINIWDFLNPSVAEPENDEHNGDGINGVEHRDGNAQDNI